MRPLALVAAALALSACGAPGAQAAKVAGCPLFPRSWSTNQKIDRAPVAPDSDAIVASMGAGDRVHPDFGSGLYEGRAIGIPYDVVSSKTRRSRVRFEYAGESDRGPYPIPPGVHIEGGEDRHALLVDRSSCRLYELFALSRDGGGWTAGSGAIWSMRKPKLRPAGWTSADAAGLPILPLLARWDEVKAGRIDHAIRMTAARTRRAYVFPARHFASSLTDPALPRMGERLRLKAGVDVSGFPAQARVVAQAMKTYGVIIADNGSDWFISGAPHPRWDNDALRSLKTLRGRDFEVVTVTR